ncbi:MAG: hypothetical protein AAF686_08005, partial [Pseudomonadota bacterium]
RDAAQAPRPGRCCAFTPWGKRASLPQITAGWMRDLDLFCTSEASRRMAPLAPHQTGAPGPFILDQIALCRERERARFGLIHCDTPRG